MCICTRTHHYTQVGVKKDMTSEQFKQTMSQLEELMGQEDEGAEGEADEDSDDADDEDEEAILQETFDDLKNSKTCGLMGREMQVLEAFLLVCWIACFVIRFPPLHPSSTLPSIAPLLPWWFWTTCWAVCRRLCDQSTLALGLQGKIAVSQFLEWDSIQVRGGGSCREL